jgi:hypothetical protein
MSAPARAKEAGDRAFNQGLETFQFKPRPALPQTQDTIPTEPL